MERPLIARKVVEWLGARADRWSVDGSQDSNGHWVVALDHPASAGLRVETGTADETRATSMVLGVLEQTDEINIAAAAPPLEHSDLLAGLRTIAAMFQWENVEIGSLAFLMFENGHLTHVETAGVSGYVGHEALMKPRSPTE